MMTFSDEILMAFADGELDPATRQQVAAALAHDPALAQQVAQHQALRASVYGAFAAILDEPVPPGLMPLRRAHVVQLDVVRAKKSAQAPLVSRPPKQRRNWLGARWPGARWPGARWGALAASVLVGVVIGHFGLPGAAPDNTQVASAAPNGSLMAQGKLDHALSSQLASAAPNADSAVQIGISFVSTEGNYCRSFQLTESKLAGLACRSGSSWQIPLMLQGSKPASQAYRMAASDMPAAVLAAIDQRIAGTGLDAKAEAQALARHWQR